MEDLNLTLDFGTGNHQPRTAAAEDPPLSVYDTTIVKLARAETTKKKPKLVVHFRIDSPQKVDDEVTKGRVVLSNFNLPNPSEKPDTNSFYLEQLGQLLVAAGVTTPEKFAQLKGKVALPLGKLLEKKCPIHFIPGDSSAKLYNQLTPLNAAELEAARAGTLKVADKRRKGTGGGADKALDDEGGGSGGGALDGDDDLMGGGGGNASAGGAATGGSGDPDDLFA